MIRTSSQSSSCCGCLVSDPAGSWLHFRCLTSHARSLLIFCKSVLSPYEFATYIVNILLAAHTHAQLYICNRGFWHSRSSPNTQLVRDVCISNWSLCDKEYQPLWHTHPWDSGDGLLATWLLKALFHVLRHYLRLYASVDLESDLSRCCANSACHPYNTRTKHSIVT